MIAIDTNRNAGKNSLCAISEFQLFIFGLKCPIVMTADKNHSNLIFVPHHHTILYHNKREALALVHKIRNQDLEPCPRALKERQGQNCPGKNVFSNFPVKTKVAPFVFANLDYQFKPTCFYNLGPL